MLYVQLTQILRISLNVHEAERRQLDAKIGILSCSSPHPSWNCFLDMNQTIFTPPPPPALVSLLHEKNSLNNELHIVNEFSNSSTGRWNLMGKLIFHNSRTAKKPSTALLRVEEIDSTKEFKMNFQIVCFVFIKFSLRHLTSGFAAPKKTSSSKKWEERGGEEKRIMALKEQKVPSLEMENFGMFFDAFSQWNLPDVATNLALNCCCLSSSYRCSRGEMA